MFFVFRVYARIGLGWVDNLDITFHLYTVYFSCFHSSIEVSGLKSTIPEDEGRLAFFQSDVDNFQTRMTKEVQLGMQVYRKTMNISAEFQQDKIRRL